MSDVKICNGCRKRINELEPYCHIEVERFRTPNGLRVSCREDQEVDLCDECYSELSASILEKANKISEDLSLRAITGK